MSTNGSLPPTWDDKTPDQDVNLFFEDNFDPTHHISGDKPEFKKLDDSSEYLEILESRLARLKKDPNVLRQLTEKREQCMRQLLTGNGNGIATGSQISLDQAVGVATEDSRTNEIRRRINPQQPVSVGEIVPIVKYDQLQKIADEEDDNDDADQVGTEDSVSR